MGKEGAAVYFTGRTEKEYEGAVMLGGSLSVTEELIRQAGGIGCGIRCDHTRDEETKAVVERIVSERGKIDVLVNSVWGGI